MKQRSKSFSRNENLEKLLNEINSLLLPVQENININFQKTKYPIILLVGCARAGSTLMMQWLANSRAFAYPTNLISRFYSAPFIGSKIQQMLTDPNYRFKDEFSDVTNHISYQSELGKTAGLLAPNEFFYFWRRFFKFGEIQQLDKDEIEKVDIKRFCSELASIESAFEKPLAMKGHIINWNISFISKAIPNTIFVYLNRDPYYNAQSLLEARINFYGKPQEWYSFKPPEYQMLKDLDPYRQVAGQVYFTNRAIQKELSKVDSARWLEVNYEQFCESPRTIYRKIKEMLAVYSYDLKSTYTGPKNFSSKNTMRLPKKYFDLIVQSYDQLKEQSK